MKKFVKAFLTMAMCFSMLSSNALAAESEIPGLSVLADEYISVSVSNTEIVYSNLQEFYVAAKEEIPAISDIELEKHIGDKVIGATTSKSGYFKMQATKVGDDTALAQIVRLVDEATSSKAPIAKLADKVSGVFVPVVISIALIAVVVWLNSYCDSLPIPWGKVR